MSSGKFGMKISQAQIQSLRMTPQLQQAIKLLQLSRMEFEAAIRKEMEENPILEEIYETREDEAKREVETPGVNENQNEMQDSSADSSDPRKQEEFEWENYAENYANKMPRENFTGNDEIMNYENIITKHDTLYDYLLWQLNLFGFNEEEYIAAAIVIGYIEEDGYLKTPLESIAEEEKIDVKEIEEILPFIQEFDPPGVGARNLQECLLIQAKHLQEDTYDIVELINNHLKDLEKKNYEGIAKAMGRELEDVIDMCKIVYEMEPKPGRAFISSEPQYITPDVYVHKVGEEFVVSLNEDGMPRLRVSNFYKSALKDTDTNKVTQEYIKGKLKAAVFLIKSIHQRQRTIYRVTESIVRHQKDFFEKGPAFIKPMILRDIANDIGIHESTVSRVTSNKFVFTSHGIFELKYFFNSGISKSNGDSLASESVKLKIKDLVANENVKSPLSDQKIVDLLKKEGIKIARRTVAKYRDMLGILPSSKRKKYF